VLTRFAACLACAALVACDADRGPETELASARSEQGFGVTVHRVRGLATENATSATDRPVEGRVLELESSRDVVVPLGDTFKVELVANSGSGHAWTIRLPGDAVLEPLGEPARAPIDRGVMGGRVRWTFAFRPVRPGTCDLGFDLVRPWEAGATPEKTVTLHVTVGAASAPAASK
jgi:predicted secreted protein